MRLTVTRALVIPAFIRRTTVRDVSHERDLSRPSVITSVSYHNYLDTTVHILTRNGMMFQVPSAYCNREDVGLVVRVEYKIYNDVAVVFDNLSNREGCQVTAENKTLEGIVRDFNKRTSGYRNAGLYRREVVEYRFLLGEIVSNENGLYSPELDIVITHDVERAKNNIHPYSDLGQIIIDQDDDKDVVPVSPFSFYIVDHGNRFTKRYIRFGELVYEVPILQDISREEGFHIVTPAPCERDDKNTLIITDVISLEEAEARYPIYRTIEDAKQGSKADIERLDREHRNQLMEYRTLELKFKEEELGVKKTELVHREDDLGFKRDELKYKRYTFNENLTLDKIRRQDDTVRQQREDMLRRQSEDRNNRRAIRSEIADTVRSLSILAGACVTLYKLAKSSK